jgi:cytochrome c oxidase subunit III
MMPIRVVADVSALPRTVFGHRALMWWGTLGFIVIEGTTLFVCVVSYLYIRGNFATWPPEHVFRPELLIPTIQVGLMLASLIPMRWADRASRAMDLHGVRRWFLVCSILALGMTVLRWFEFDALNVRWDSNAYGSVAWAVLITHSTLLLLELAETAAFTVLLFGREVEERDLSGASDNAFYWYFLVGAWVPLYVLVFLSPYFL